MASTTAIDSVAYDGNGWRFMSNPALSIVGLGVGPGSAPKWVGGGSIAVCLARSVSYALLKDGINAHRRRFEEGGG